MAVAWVVRSGRYGERDDWALRRQVSGGGWHEVPDLTSITNKGDMDLMVLDLFGDGPAGRVASYAGQLWALRSRIKVGDLMVMPMKTTKQLALGRVTRGYEYLADEQDASCRHVVGVDWQIQVPRTSVKQDLLYTLGSAISIFAPTRNNAIARLEHMLAHGIDPGALGAVSRGDARPAPNRIESALDSASVDNPEAEPDVEELAADRIATRIGEEFSGHGFTHLAAALLRSEGFQAEEAPAGPDGGIDIIAGRGVLGLESPRLIVQVKSGQVASEVVSQLNGLVSSHGADFGLLVTWAGLSRAARDAVRHQRFRVKVWDSKAVVDLFISNYDRLPEDVRARIPLKSVWVLRDPAG